MKFFIKLKTFIYASCFIDSKGDGNIYLSQRKANYVYARTDHTNRYFSTDQDYSYKRIYKYIKYKYIHIGISKYEYHNEEIKSLFKHPNPKMKNKVLWYLFPPNKKNKEWETRVVLCT